MWVLTYSRSLLVGPWKSSFTMATLAERECWPQQPTLNQKLLLLVEEQNAINILIPPERQIRPNIILYGYTSSTTNCILAMFKKKLYLSQLFLTDFLLFNGVY
jgi:hypothetical protein